MTSNLFALLRPDHLNLDFSNVTFGLGKGNLAFTTGGPSADRTA